MIIFEDGEALESITTPVGVKEFSWLSRRK
jgi:hypothetical protein